MRSPAATLDNFITAMLGSLTQTGRAWARVGVVALVVAAAMSFDFGSQVSWKHGVFLACLTFVAAFGPESAYKAWQENKFGSSIVIAVFASGLLLIELGSHMSYTAGIRGHNIAETRVANVKYDGAQDSVSESKTNLHMWEKRLAALESENAWVTAVTAEALRAQLASANLAIEQEAARGGCKSKCLERTKERDTLASKIALAEEKSSLTKRIEATKAVLGRAREKASTTEHRSSAVMHANQALAKAVAFIGMGSLVPSDHINQGAEISANWAMALAGTGVPAFALFIAGLYRRPEAYTPETDAPSIITAAAPVAPTRGRGYTLEPVTIAKMRALSL